jgi:hypothetical protein
MPYTIFFIFPPSIVLKKFQIFYGISKFSSKFPTKEEEKNDFALIEVMNGLSKKLDKISLVIFFPS